MSPEPHKCIEASLRLLTCFDDVIKGPVLTFAMARPAPIDLQARLDLLTSAQDIVDTWGAGQFIVFEGKKQPSAIRIGEGLIYPEASGQDSCKFYWSREATSENFCSEEFDLRRKIVVGATKAPVTVNSACGLGENPCKDTSKNFLRPLGKFKIRETDHKHVGANFEKYTSAQVSASYAIFRGQTLKKNKLEMSDSELISFLDELWDVQVSVIARRILYDSLPSLYLCKPFDFC